MGKNRADCPACGRPLKYDAEHDAMVCPMGHYSEPVKNDINVDSHDSVVNNYYQGPAKQQVDNRGSYEQMVERVQAFVADSDDDGFKNAIYELRESYPQTYFGKLANLWINGNAVDFVFNGEDLRNFLRALKGLVRDELHEPVQEGSQYDNLQYELVCRATKKLKEFGIASREQEETMKEMSSDLDRYIASLEAILEFIDTAESDGYRKLVKYDFETEYLNIISPCRDLAFDALKAFCDLGDCMENYVSSNIGRVKDVVDKLGAKKARAVSKPVQNSSGFIATLCCLGVEFLALLFSLIGMILISKNSGAALTLCGLSMLCMVPVHLVLYIIRGKQARDFSWIFLILNIVSGIGFFTSVCIVGSNSTGGYVTTILGMGCAAAHFVRMLIKLPRTIRLNKELKTQKTNYKTNQAEAQSYLAKGGANAQFTDILDMAQCFSYDFSKWGR